MLRKGCEAYLAHMVSTEDDAPSISDILVVRKFADVFLEDLPGLPPVGEMEFGIDLLLILDLYLGHPIGWLRQS